MSRIIAAAFGILTLIFLGGCVMHETYGPSALTQNERAVVEGYWHYRFLYDEELHIVSVDGRREGKTLDWPYAYSVSLPQGNHWLQLAVLRNSGRIAMCAMEGTFEAQHHYKLAGLQHDQFLLAHPSSPLFPASVSLEITAPSKPDQRIDIPAVCGKGLMCRQNSDCFPNDYCQSYGGFDFGICQSQKH